jgi:hypothetical protein
LNALDDVTSVALEADSTISVTGLNGLTLSATNSVDTFTFSANDTGVSISGLLTGDVLDFLAIAMVLSS